MDFEFLVNSIMNSYKENGGVNRTGAENLPNRANVVAALSDLQALVFPGFKYGEQITEENLLYITERHVSRIISILTAEIQKAFLRMMAIHQNENSDSEQREKQFKNSHCFKLAQKAVETLIAEIPALRKKIQMDADAILQGDPAARSLGEVILSYPGLEAILIYRIAHFLHKNGIPLIPRIMTEHAHNKTGIDIHPGAEIGESFLSTTERES